MLWYKIRAIVLYRLASFFSKIFSIDIPPFPSVCAYITKKDKVLVVDLTYEKGYNLPGGGIKAGEDAIQALKREVKEETGLKVEDYKFIDTYPGKSHGIDFIATIYKVKTSGEIKGSKEGAPKWVTLKEAYEKCAFEDVRKFLKSELKG